MNTRTTGIILLCALLLSPVTGHALLAEGDQAPSFTVESLDHQMVSLSDYSDKVVVLFLLTTSNSRCKTAAPAYEQNVYQPYKDQGVIVLGIDVDPTGETFDDLAAFRDEYGLTFPLAMDVNGECWADYRADDSGNVPVFYVIDCCRTIRHVRLGYRTGREEYIIEAIEGISPAMDLSLDRVRNDMTPYMPGDTMGLFAGVENPGPETAALAYIAIGVGSGLFFWPSYGTAAEGLPLTLPAGFVVRDYPVESITFGETFPAGLHSWYAALLDANTGAWLSDIETVSWPFGQSSRPPGDRASLVIPDDLWSYVRRSAGHEGAPLGYLAEDMDRIGGHEFRLKVVNDLFRDVTEIPRVTGEIGDVLLENYLNPAAIATYCFAMLEYEEELGFSRGARGVAKSRQMAPEDFVFVTPDDETNWETLQPEIQSFVVSIVNTTASAAPDVEAAFDKAFFADSLGVAVGDLDMVPRSQLYSLVTEPWWNYSNAQADGFEAMKRLDLASLGTGTANYLSGMTSAIADLKVWLGSNVIQPTSFETIEIDTAIGRVCVCGTGNERVMDDYALIVDLGGSDFYDGDHAVPRSFSNPIGAVIDIAGNDRYDGGSSAAKLCCGLLGIGAIFDLSGDDEYLSGASGVACAWHGSGILMDYEGNDSYRADSATADWCQAAAHGGLGLLIDVSGSDDYYTQPGSGQGFASTLGFGALVDVSGDDTYHAEGLWSDFFYNNTALAQGAGFGRRADSGADGRSLAGGIGILVEGDGDDDYWGPVYAQGTGYWWALGALEDRAGNDTYRCLQLSLGGTPHMGLACAVDLMGDDIYNVGNTLQVGQNMGSGRDLAVAVFIDGDGDDEYEHRVRSAGAGDIQAIGLFWDRYGSDSYTMANSPYATPSDQSYGASTERDPMGNFRDEMCTLGVFLDTSGTDTYSFEDYGGTCGRPGFDENKQWWHNTGPYLWGYGLDMDYYEASQAP